MNELAEFTVRASLASSIMCVLKEMYQSKKKVVTKRIGSDLITMKRKNNGTAEILWKDKTLELKTLNDLINVTMDMEKEIFQSVMKKGEE